MQEGDAISSWIKKSLDAGDDPKVIKAAMKKHGYDPHLVDAILKSWAKKESPAEEKSACAPDFRNAELKGEIEAILSKKNPAPVPPKIKFSFPKISLPRPSLQSIKWTLLALIAVLMIVAISFALDWYADRMAARVVL